MRVCPKCGVEKEDSEFFKSKQVCGLHVWWNMQVIPSLVNIAKGNRQWPNKPEQLS